MALYDYSLAGNDTLGTYAPNQLITGEMNIVTGPGSIGAGQVLDKYTVLARKTSDGSLYALNTTASDGTQNAVAILMTAINTTAAAATTPLGVALPANPAGAVATVDEVYWGGCFNPDLLVWPSSLTTNLAKIATFDRSNIKIQRPL